MKAKVTYPVVELAVLCVEDALSLDSFGIHIGGEPESKDQSNGKNEESRDDYSDAEHPLGHALWGNHTADPDGKSPACADWSWNGVNRRRITPATDDLRSSSLLRFYQFSLRFLDVTQRE